MSSFTRICVGILLAVFCVISNSASAQTANLDNEGDSFAIAPQSGLLCVASTAKDLVSLYPAFSKQSTQGRIDRPVGNQPVSVIHRLYGGKPYFIVACSGDKTIWVLDEATLAVVKTIHTTYDPLCISAALRGDSPFVFYGCREGLCCVDLRTFTEDIDLSHNAGMTSFQDICVSSDGHLIYSRSLGVTPTGRTVCSIEDSGSGPPVVKMLDYEHESVSQFRADPFGPLVSYYRQYGNGEDPYDALPDLKTAPACYMENRPLIVNYDQNELKFYSYNTLKELSSLPINSNGNENLPRTGRANRRAFPTNLRETVLADEKNECLLICSKTSVRVIELSSIDLPDEPLLGVEVEGVTVLNPDVTGSLLIKKMNPDSKVELKDPKAGMKLEGDHFSWAPTGEDIGSVALNVHIQSGGFDRTQTFMLVVRRPEIDLPFVPQEAVISDDGNFALLLEAGENGQDDYRRRRGGQRADSSARLVLVDLLHRSIAVERVLSKNVHAIEIDAHHAYAAASDADAIYVYSLKDLTEERKIFASAPVRQLKSTGSRLYAMSQQNVSSAYSLPDLKPLDDEKKGDAPNQYNPFIPMIFPQRRETGWALDGMLYDSDMSHVVQLEHPSGFTDAIPQPFNPANMNGQGVQQSTAWGLSIQNDRLMRMPSQTLGTLHGTNAAFLRDIPAVVTLVIDTGEDQNQRGQQPRVTTSLSFYDLVSVTRQASVVLSDEVRTNQQQYGGYPGQAGQNVLVSSVRVAALVQDKLYVLDTSVLDRNKFPQPPQVSCEPGVKVIDPVHATTIAFTASHAKAPVEFSLDPDIKGVEIDKTTGNLTIDGPAMVAKSEELLGQSIGQQFNNFQTRQNQRTAQQAYDALAEAPTAKFTAITGNKPDGYPMLVRMNVVAMDADQQKISHEMSVFVCLPPEKVINMVTERQNEMVTNQQAQQQAFARQRGLATQPANSQPQIDALNVKIAELQKQNSELTAQLQMLKVLLLEQKKTQ